jgi:DNA-directed RNA polymerase specialized sigma24 family protein
MFNYVIRNFRGNRELAHDVAVETWMIARRKVFESEGAVIGFCLFKVKRMAIDLIRKRREITGCVELIEATMVHDEAGQIRAEALHEFLAKARATSPHIYQHIITFYYYERLSDREIAVLLLSPYRGGGAGLKFIQSAR